MPSDFEHVTNGTELALQRGGFYLGEPFVPVRCKYRAGDLRNGFAAYAVLEEGRQDDVLDFRTALPRGDGVPVAGNKLA